MRERYDQYNRYKALGGIINEKDWKSVLERAKAGGTDGHTLGQAESIAKFSGVTLTPLVAALYCVLRSDEKPPEVENHHSQMSDQRLFAEALRMLDDAESLNKLIAAYPNISFD